MRLPSNYAGLSRWIYLWLYLPALSRSSCAQLCVTSRPLNPPRSASIDGSSCALDNQTYAARLGEKLGPEHVCAPVKLKGDDGQWPAARIIGSGRLHIAAGGPTHERAQRMDGALMRITGFTY